MRNRTRLILELSSNDFSNLKSSLRMSLAFLPRSLYLGGAIPDRKREGCRMIRQMAWVAYTAKCQISCLARVNAKPRKNQLSYGATPHASCRHERLNFILFAMRCCITLPALPYAVLVPEMHRGRWGATGAQAKEWTGAKTTAANVLLLVHTRRYSTYTFNRQLQCLLQALAGTTVRWS